MNVKRAMNARGIAGTGRRRARERGFSMVELMIAITIGLFLMAGVLTILQDTRSTNTNQNLLAQLQDAERVAMTMITDVVQQAGYYPNAETIASTTALPVDATFTQAGQSVFGGSYGGPNAYGDTVTVRYQGDSTNNVLDCGGSVIAAGTNEDMQFYVSTGNAGEIELYCSINGGNGVPLVALFEPSQSNPTAPAPPGGKWLSITYGVDSNGSGSPNVYLPASSMAPGAGTDYWPSVYSVKLTVQFANPLYGQAGQTLQTIPFSRVIGIMNRTGVNIL